MEEIVSVAENEGINLIMVTRIHLNLIVFEIFEEINSRPRGAHCSHSG
jgi:hypothetical protein